MSEPWRTERVPSDFKPHADSPPVYQPHMDALLAELNGETTPELRSVVASEIGIPAGYAPPAWVLERILPTFKDIRRAREEENRAFDLLERADGSLWSYDAPAMVAAYHAAAPNAVVLCKILGPDPAM